MVKFGGFGDFRGGGRFSGSLTLGLVAAGVIAKKLIKPLEVNAKIIEIGGEKENFETVLDNAIKENDSVGGIISCKVENVTAGLGEPFFNSVESLIAHGIFSIPAVRGIEFGSGFKHSTMKGSETNDLIENKTGKTKTNHCGGINGGITNGNSVVFNTVIKATSSIKKIQNTYNFEKNKTDNLLISGRHDVCIALRVPPVIEAITAIVFADLLMLENKIPRVIK
jgi:chorismate synthase